MKKITNRILGACASFLLLTACGATQSADESVGAPAEAATEQAALGTHHAGKVGLGLYFLNGTWNQDFSTFPNPERPTALHVVDGSPRYLQELYITSSVPTTLQDGLNPVITSGDFANLNWNGVQQVDEDWRLEFSGASYQHTKFYRNADWMRRYSIFALTVLDNKGRLLDGRIYLAGGDNRWGHLDDFFERRFVARTISTGCASATDCSNPEAVHLAQAAVQLAKALHPWVDFSISSKAAKIQVLWSESNRLWEVPVVHDAPSATGYGLGVQLDEVSPPASGYYMPGDSVSVRVTFTDGDGQALFSPGVLPSYGDASNRRTSAKGLRYLNFVDSPMLYYWHKDPQADMEVFLGGPLHLMTTVGSAPITPYSLFLPQIPSADPAVDGWLGLVGILPPTPVLVGCLFDPGSGACDIPTSDVFSFTIPENAPLGTYVTGIKARREWEGEPVAKASSLRIQVGPVATEFPGFEVAGMDNDCASCHTGNAALPVAAHGFPALNEVGPECMTCHTSGYYFEPDAGIDDRLLLMHERTNRLQAP